MTDSVEVAGMNVRRSLPILATIMVGVLLGVWIISWNESDLPGTAERPQFGEEEGSAAMAGPQGGKLFVQDNIGLELIIHETAAYPHFRLYPYHQGQPLPPADMQVTIALMRLGQPAQLYAFRPEDNYLISDDEVEEPHSFELVITAEWQDQSYRWGYSQVEGRVQMSDESMHDNGIELAAAGPAVIQPRVTLPGEIIFNEHTIVHVVPRLPGMVVAVERHHGQAVEKGEVLVVMESAMLADLRSQYLVARQRLALAQTVHDREKQLWQEKITAKQDYLVAKQQWEEARIESQLAAERLQALGVRPESGLSGKNLARYEIRSPIGGIVIDKAVVTGEAVKADKTVFIVADVSTIWAAIRVFPRDLHRIHVGQRAIVHADAHQLVRAGKVIYITTLLDELTRTATARVELDNHDQAWRPGMFVKADLLDEDIAVPLAVPLAALQRIEDQLVVFGRYGEFFEMRPLKLGRSDGQMVEVISGLSAGERYAVSNSFIIKAELVKAGVAHDH
ncbi:MAG: efflux RND transporter periplasmic adaptor subunit [Nitrosomonas halophila]